MDGDEIFLENVRKRLNQDLVEHNEKIAREQAERQEKLNNFIKEKGVRPMTYDDNYNQEDYELDLFEQEFRDHQQKAARLHQRWYQREISRVKQNPVLMNKLQARGSTPEDYVRAMQSPQGQQATHALYDKGEDAWLDLNIGKVMKEAGIPGGGEERSREKPADRREEVMRRAARDPKAVRPGGDDYIDLLLKDELPDDDRLLQYGVDSAPDPRRRKGGRKGR